MTFGKNDTHSITTLYHYTECHYVALSCFTCCYSEWHYAEWHYARCHYAEFHYAQCHYAEWHYGE